MLKCNFYAILSIFVPGFKNVIYNYVRKVEMPRIALKNAKTLIWHNSETLPSRQIIFHCEMCWRHGIDRYSSHCSNLRSLCVINFGHISARIKPMCMEYFRTLPAGWEGGGCFGLSAFFQTTGLILYPKTAFDSPGMDFLNMFRNFNWMSLMPSQIRSKVRFLLWHRWLHPGKVFASSWNKVDETAWIEPGILLSTLLSLCWPHVK